MERFLQELELDQIPEPRPAVKIRFRDVKINSKPKTSQQNSKFQFQTQSNLQNSRDISPPKKSQFQQRRISSQESLINNRHSMLNNYQNVQNQQDQNVIDEHNILNRLKQNKNHDQVQQVSNYDIIQVQNFDSEQYINQNQWTQNHRLQNVKSQGQLNKQNLKNQKNSINIRNNNQNAKYFASKRSSATNSSSRNTSQSQIKLSAATQNRIIRNRSEQLLQFSNLRQRRQINNGNQLLNPNQLSQKNQTAHSQKPSVISERKSDQDFESGLDQLSSIDRQESNTLQLMHFKSGQSYGNQQLMAQQHLNMSKTIMRQRTGAPNNQMLYNTLSNGGDNQFGITLSKYQSTQQPVNRDLDQNIMFTSIDRRQNNIRPHHGGSQNSMDQQNGRSIVLPSSIQIGRVGINRNTSQKDFRNKKMSAIFQNGDQSISSKNMFQMQMSSSHKSQNEGTKSQFLTKQSQMNNLGSFTDNLQQNSKPLYQTIASNNQQNFQMTLQEQEKKRSKDIMMKLFPKQLKFIDQSEKDQQVQMSKLGYIRKLNYQSQANLYANQQTNHHHTQKHSVFCSQKHSMISTHQNQVENHDQNLRKIIQRQDTVESSNMHLSPLTQTVNFKVDGKLNQWSQMTDVAYKLIKSLKRDTAQTKEIFQETQDQIKSLNYKLVQVIPKKDSHIILEEKKDNNFKISHGQEHIFAKISIKNMPQPLFVISIKQKQKTQNSDLDYQIYFSRYDRFPDPDSKVSDLQRRSHNQMYLYQDLSSKVFKEDWLYIGIHNIRLKNLNQSQISIRFAFQRYSKQDFRQNEYRGSSMGLVSSNSSPRFSKTGDGSKMMRIKLQSQLKDILDDQDRCQEFIDNIAIQVFLNSKPSYMSVSDFKVNTAQKKKEDLDMESHQKMLFLLNKRQIINGFKAQLEERKRQIQSKRLFKQKWLIMQVQHKVGLKILENIQIRKQQKDFAVKLFFSTLKLLKVWRIYVKKFGFPKSVRDHKLTRHYLSLTNNLMYEPVCDRAKLLLLAFLRGKKEKKLIFKQFEKFSLQIETMQRVFRAQLKLAATRTKLLSKFWEKKVIQLQKDLSKKRGSNRTKKDVKVLKNLFLLPDNLKTNCLKDYLLKCKRAYMKAISEWLEQYNKFKDSQHNVFLLQKMITFNQNKEEEQSGINQHRKQFSQEYKAKLSELSCDFEEDEVDQQVKVKFSKIKNAQTQDKQVKFQPQGSFKGLQKSLTLNSQQSFNSTVLQEYLNNERVQDMNQLDDNSENSKSKTEKNKSKNQKSGFAKQAQNKQSSFKINHNRKSNNDNSNNDNASSKNQLYEQNAIDQKQTSYQDLMNKKPKFIYLPTSQVMTDLVYQCTWEFVKSEIEREKFSKKVANQVMNTDMMSSDGGMSDQENWNKGLLASDDKNNLNTGDAKTLITELTD